MFSSFFFWYEGLSRRRRSLVVLVAVLRRFIFLAGVFIFIVFEGF